MLTEFIKDFLKKELEKDQVCFSGIMAKYLKDNGNLARNMEKGFGFLQQETVTKDSGLMEDNMETEFTNIKIVHIKASSLMD
jgi:hypothetical protein